MDFQLADVDEDVPAGSSRAIDHPREVERLRASVRARRGELVRPMRDHVAEVEALYTTLVP